MADAFKPGDVVKIRSASPHMTVEDLDRGRCWCVWFDERYEVRRDCFPADCLEAVKPYGPARVL